MDIEQTTDREATGSSGSSGSSEAEHTGGTFRQPDEHSLLRRNGQALFDEVRAFLARHILVSDESDLDLLTLWIVHTYLTEECYTTPRLVIESAVPGSGKTTLLEHLKRLCLDPVLAGTLSSSAVISRLLQQGPRTLLIDEVDRLLDPKRPGSSDLAATLNSGYKKGEGRMVNVPTKGGGWEVQVLPTFAAVALAGNSPHLPEDTRTRSIRVLLLRDSQGQVEESDWEDIGPEADDLAARVREWADAVREEVRRHRPALPTNVTGRSRERWAPLKRVADVVGGDWPARVDELARRDLARLEAEVEEGLAIELPHVVLLRDIAAVWSEARSFMSTQDLINALVHHNPRMWGRHARFDSQLTPQRLGRMLVKNYNIHAERQQGGNRRRGYRRASFDQAFSSFNLGGEAGD